MYYSMCIIFCYLDVPFNGKIQQGNNVYRSLRPAGGPILIGLAGVPVSPNLFFTRCRMVFEYFIEGCRKYEALPYKSATRTLFKYC